MTWLAPHDFSPGRSAVLSGAVLQFRLMIKVLFKLPPRQTTGLVASLLKMAGLDWSVPDYTGLCRRQKSLAAQAPYRRADGALNLLDLGVFGERTAARDPDHRTAEIRSHIALMNRFRVARC